MGSRRKHTCTRRTCGAMWPTLAPSLHFDAIRARIIRNGTSSIVLCVCEVGRVRVALHTRSTAAAKINSTRERWVYEWADSICGWNSSRTHTHTHRPIKRAQFALCSCVCVCAAAAALLICDWLRAPLRHSLSAFPRPVAQFGGSLLRAAERWTCGSRKTSVKY